MHSTSKTRLDPASLSAIARQALEAELRGAEELREGYFNAAYRLDLADGRRCVLKVAPPPEVRVMRYEVGIMRAEVQAMALARPTGVPVPAVLAYDDSHRLVPSDYMVMEFVSGTPLHLLQASLSTDERATIDRELGRITRCIATVAADRFGYLAQSPLDTGWEDAFRGMVAGLLADGHDLAVALPMTDRQIEELVSRLSPTLQDVRAACLVHWDLWAGNVMVDPATRAITGILDWERALWGDPLIEAPFRGCRADSPYLLGYGLPLLDGERARVRRSLYNLYLFLIMIIECAFRQYATDAQERWARQQLTEEWERLLQFDRPA